MPLSKLRPRILVIRKRRVLLDAHLAELYDVTPKRLREQVRRNRERFPDDFMFELTLEEAEGVVPQNAAPSRRSRLGGHLPFVFTQEGIAMLSGVLRSPRAVRANIEIMRAFVYAKTRERWHSAALTRLEELERKFLGHDQDIERLFTTLRDLMDPPEKPRRKIGFEPGSKS
ncbi:MAG: hypothetical protein A2V88_05510 [Elusimicrobia bacterium RBG_16_66_12]|nr:MAG: hypothetical protein A2V88_05510 [Elusimicrobia bacterium RBG_16_66_12]